MKKACLLAMAIAMATLNLNIPAFASPEPTAAHSNLGSGVTLAPVAVYIAQVKPLTKAGDDDKPAQSATIWLLRNYWVSKVGLPANFRTMQSPYKNTAAAVKPASRQGLDTLYASGSAEFSLDNLNHIKDVAKGHKLIDLDLRQESHGYLDNSLPVSWYTGENQINWGKTLKQIDSDEDARLNALGKAGMVTTYDLKSVSNGSGLKVGVEPQSIKVSKTCTEEKLCQVDSVSYIRLPVADDQSPTDDIVDQFVTLVKDSDDNVWFHMHCAAGHGRTTTFLTLLDMMRNAKHVSLEDIVSRQYQLGGIDLLNTNTGGWKQPYAIKRAQFIRQFYQYCLAEIDDKFTLPWSTWHHQ